VLKAKRTIVTTGTYLNSCTHIGSIQKKEGPQGLARSNNLSQQLLNMGFMLLRFKTGTPPRIAANSINYQEMKKETGDNKKLAFSLFNQTFIPFKKQAACFLTFTNAKTHKIITDNIDKSAMYSGNIKGKGPRYCPSIEDKVIRFHDKTRHQLFVEPEAKSLDTMYLQGLSTSFPADIQEKIVHSIVGLEKAKIVKYAYAIEYDVVDPTQL
jgi:tRNA uridine 5-carboxymethylaminomethyl modification enzyme